MPVRRRRTRAGDIAGCWHDSMGTPQPRQGQTAGKARVEKLETTGAP
jgi:hypothetical protein